jgi:quercetin dioxygenase-like cupin family protein
MPNQVRYKDTAIIPVKGPITRRILAHSPTLMTVEFTFADVFVDVPHSHPHEQISVVIEGLFDVNYDGELIRMEPGDSILFPSHVPHCVNCIVPGKLVDAFTPRRDDFLK